MDFPRAVRCWRLPRGSASYKASGHLSQVRPSASVFGLRLSKGPPRLPFIGVSAESIFNRYRLVGSLWVSTMEPQTSDAAYVIVVCFWAKGGGKRMSAQNAEEYVSMGGSLISWLSA